MTITAKFYVDSIVLRAGGTGEVHLGAVTRGPENATWAKYTPWGEIKMGVAQDSAAFAEFMAALDDDEKPEFLLTFERSAPSVDE